MNNPVARIPQEVEQPSERVEYTPMDSEDLVNFVIRTVQESSGQDDTIAEVRNDAFNYYMARPNGTELPGRSQVVDSSIQDSIEAVLAQIMPIFASSELASFQATSSGDEEQAHLESVAVNNIIFNFNDGYKVIYEAVKDALVSKNGILRVFIDEDLDIKYEEYEGLSDMEYNQVLQPQSDSQQIAILEENEYDSDNIDVDMGDLGVDSIGVVSIETLHDIRLNRITSRRKLKIISVPPEQFLFISDQDSINLKDCGLAGRRFIIRRYELIDMGFDADAVADLPATSYSTRSDDHVRNQFSSESDHDSSQKQTDPIEVIDVDIRVDADGDGYAELRNIVIAGRTLLVDRPISCISYAAGTSFIMPHRFLGLSFYDKLKDIQDSKTAVKRQYWDNLNHNNNRRLAVNIKGISDPDSVLDSKPAGVLKCKTDPREVVFPIPVDDIGPSCIQALDYLDRQRTEKVGASLDMQSQQNQVSAETAHGVERLVSSKEEMASMITTTIGETLIQSLYLIVHKMSRDYFPHPINLKVQNQWQQTNPTDWLEREKVNINVAASPGEKIRRADSLSKVLETQMGLIDKGKNGILASDQNVYNTLSDFVRATNTGHTERYWINPKSPEAQKTAQMNGQQAQQEKAKQDEVTKVQSDLQIALGQAEMLKAQNGTMKNQIEELQTVIDAHDKTGELGFKYEKLYQDTANKLLEMGIDVTAQKQTSETLASE